MLIFLIYIIVTPVPVALAYLDLGECQNVARILLSNSTTLNGREMLTTYGISKAAELCRQFKLNGLEVTFKRCATCRGIDRIRGEVPIIGIHLPWEFDITWRAIVGWNPKAGKGLKANIEANLKGKFAFFSQAETEKALKVGRELDPQPEYYVIHPDAFANMRFVPWRRLRKIRGLCFENNWPVSGYDGVAAALRFAVKSQAGIVVDTCHLGLVEADAADLWQAYLTVKDRVRVFHVSDVDLWTRQEHRIPGRGNIGLLPFLEKVVADGFDGIYVLEVREPGIEPEQSIEESLKFLKRCGIVATSQE
jgi:hypothetical protein